MAPTWLTTFRALSTVKSRLPEGVAARLHAGVAAVTAATLVGGGVAFAVLPNLEPEQIDAVPAQVEAAALDLDAVMAGVAERGERASRDAARPALAELTPLSADQQAAVAKGGKLGKVVPTGKKGDAWTTTSLRVRAEASADAKEIAVLDEGTQVTRSGYTYDGWVEITLDGKPRWVSGEYLTTTKPAPKKTTPTGSGSGSSDSSSSGTSRSGSGSSGSSSSGSSRSGSSSSGSSSSGSSDEGPAATGASGSCSSQLPGLTSRARTVHNAICANYPSISSYGGVRPDSYPAHPSGRAIDVMIPNWSSSSGNALGWSIAKWLRANASNFGIAEIIFDQQIWTAQRSGDGWRTMSDRGSANQNHRNHVHVAVK